jgi:deazaflavin-dependent oxidoreductase (nitroreductase family)
MAVHRGLYRVSTGRVGGHVGANRVGVLTTVGRRSGQPRTVPLFVYRDGENHLVVASNGGTAHAPQWFENLMTHPQGWLQVGSERWPVYATLLNDDERAAWWDVVTATYPSYRRYQARTDRPIPIVRLTRATPREQ